MKLIKVCINSLSIIYLLEIRQFYCYLLISLFSIKKCCFIQAFAVFCGMGISNTQMYESSIQTSAKHRIALDVLSYHACASPEDAQKLKVSFYFYLSPIVFGLL